MVILQGVMLKMRLDRFCTVGCAFLAVLLIVPIAFAQNPNPRVTVSVGGSYLRGDRSFVVDSDEFTSEFVDGGKVRVRGTLDLTKHWSIEGDYSFGRNNQRIIELSGGTLEQRDFGARLGQVHFNLVRFFTSRQSRVRPFLTSGIGAVRFTPTAEAKALALANEFIDEPTQIDSTTLPSFTFGGGLEGRFNRWVGVRFDVKDYISPVPRFGLRQTPSGPGADFFPVDGVVHNIEAAVGIVFFFLP